MQLTGCVQNLEKPGIKIFTIPGMEKPGKIKLWTKGLEEPCTLICLTAINMKSLPLIGYAPGPQI